LREEEEEEEEEIENGNGARLWINLSARIVINVMK
jgi:hypothetical protein